MTIILVQRLFANYLAIPKFDNKKTIHKKLAALSKRCHIAASRGDTGIIYKLEAEIDILTAELWGINDNELLAIQEALGELQKAKRDSMNDVDEE